MKGTLTKTELVNQIKSSPPFRLMTKKGLTDILETAFDLIVCHLQNGGERIVLRGFGTFKGRRRRIYVGRNPSTGEIMEVPESASMAFKPSAEVLRRLNNR